MNKFVTFDLEIATEIPEGTEDWKALRPLGITCAATFLVDGDVHELQIWHPAECDETTPALPDRMNASECRVMTDYLLRMERDGFDIVTWNGLGFDFDVLAEEVCEPDYHARVADLALRHIDPAFAMFCDKGFMIGLNTAAQGMGVVGKIEGMHGDLAPVMWKQGRAAQDKVLEYVGQDAIATANVYQAILENGALYWTARSGRRNYWRGVHNSAIRFVSSALGTPEPDTSWMDNPWPRAKFYGWTER